MKRIILFAFAALLTIAAEARIIHLLPRPQQLSEKPGAGYFALGRKVVVSDPTNCWLLQSFLEENGCKTAAKSKGRIEVKLVETIPGSYDYKLEGYENEAYRLEVDENLIKIEAVSPTGVIRAVQTLQQLAEGYQGRTAIEAVSITDWPAFKLRGYMHDCGRSFIPFDDLKRQLRLLSRFKVNTFHWHLTENQGWRFEVPLYPQLTSAASMTRHPGQYYTQEQCRELEALGRRYGIIVIPEIDMPGHSAAFERAMGHSMQTPQGMNEMKNALAELANAFPLAPYIHIGADEVNINMPEFVPTMVNWLHTMGRKVVMWNPTKAQPQLADMVQLWSTAGRLIKGRPNIDCRYNYLNHFDSFADVAAIYLSNIYYAERGSEELAGTMACTWNDHVLATSDDILRQNSFYPAVIASASRAWQGGGTRYIEERGCVLPSSGNEHDDFADWEQRFLFHKAHSLKDEPIVYVRQSHVNWRISYKGKDYDATGAGIYLNHTWGSIIPALLPKPEYGDTAFAYTQVYSPDSQKVGALIELQNYSRTEVDSVPQYGRWDCKGSRIWLNDVEIVAPIWKNYGKVIDRETPLADENMAARMPIILHLQKGWNTVRLTLPYTKVPGIRLNKWMFTFVFTDPEGQRALDLDYQPLGEKSNTP
ncbi:MAG: beta-N-acetylhexosaminidase [Prevotella sp.]|nr:beta-N-acetylhexosaminidase [Prevotella sp.]